MEAIELLNRHNLKRTSCREGIIEVIMEANYALSEHEIQEKLHGNYDRTTFYRSFKTLQEHKIIHKIVVDNQVVKYELDNSVTSKKEHAHFYCNRCNKVQCIDSIGMPNAKLPPGFMLTEVEVILKGLCDMCSVEPGLKINNGD
ncbi:MAG: transcriptional repressor [Bacteroidales bacterium]|nr:transcriptional repressor [Bacteroidales bacterium]